MSAAATTIARTRTGASARSRRGGPILAGASLGRDSKSTSGDARVVPDQPVAVVRQGRFEVEPRCFVVVTQGFAARQTAIALIEALDPQLGSPHVDRGRLCCLPRP